MPFELQHALVPGAAGHGGGVTPNPSCPLTHGALCYGGKRILRPKPLVWVPTARAEEGRPYPCAHSLAPMKHEPCIPEGHQCKPMQPSHDQ